MNTTGSLIRAVLFLACVVNGTDLTAQAPATGTAKETTPAPAAAGASQPMPQRSEPLTAPAGPSSSVVYRPFIQSVFTNTRIDLTKTIVRVTQKIDGGEAELRTSSQSGILVDPSGIILTLMPCEEKRWKSFQVCFEDGAEFVAEVRDFDPKLGLLVLNLPGAGQRPTASFAKIREVKKGDVVLAVPSSSSTVNVNMGPHTKTMVVNHPYSASTIPLKGKVTEVDVDLGPGFPTGLIQTDLVLPHRDRGSLMINDNGELVGIWCDVRSEGKKGSFALPLKDAWKLLGIAVTAPDIAGSWMGVRDGSPVEYLIRRVEGFVPARYEVATVSSNVRTTFDWNPKSGKFERDEAGGRARIGIQPLKDGDRVRVSLLDPKVEKEIAQELLRGGSAQRAGELTQEWTRKNSKTAIQPVAAKPTSGEQGVVDLAPAKPVLPGVAPKTSGASRSVDNGIRKDFNTLDNPKSDQRDQSSALDEKAALRVVVNKPEAKRLVDQLQTQESAAAVEAESIRRLRKNGQGDQNERLAAEHQRKLTNFLEVAFDLKLQLEELQMKELEARLSRLDDQMRQRKLLRAKIISRRAADLIEEKALEWKEPSAAIPAGDANERAPR